MTSFPHNDSHAVRCAYTTFAFFCPYTGQIFTNWLRHGSVPPAIYSQSFYSKLASHSDRTLGLHWPAQDFDQSWKVFVAMHFCMQYWDLKTSSFFTEICSSPSGLHGVYVLFDNTMFDKVCEEGIRRSNSNYSSISALRSPTPEKSIQSIYSWTGRTAVLHRESISYIEAWIGCEGANNANNFLRT